MIVTPPPHPSTALNPGTICLLRHGAVDLPAGGKRYIGWQDLALSDLGRQQARAWADRFADTAFEAIYCSTLQRCRETARIMADRSGQTPQALPELREINLGSWEGRRIETIRTLHPCAYGQRGDQIADFRTPGGESFRDLQQRAWPAFEMLARRHEGPTLIVTHAGVIRVLLCRLLEMPLKHLFRIGQAYGALTILTKEPRGYCIRALNLPSDNNPVF